MRQSRKNFIKEDQASENSRKNKQNNYNSDRNTYDVTPNKRTGMDFDTPHHFKAAQSSSRMLDISNHTQAFLNKSQVQRNLNEKVDVESLRDPSPHKNNELEEYIKNNNLFKQIELEESASKKIIKII
jgi:hypothetical protein